MFCSKCGKENNDSSAFCSGCGLPLTDSKQPLNEENKGGKKELFTAHLLNIFSVVIPALLLGALSLMSEDSSSSGSNGGIYVSLSADTSYQHLFYAMALGLVVFIIGIVVYFAKSKKVKVSLSWVYLLGAAGAFVLLFFTAATYILATCGLGAVMFIPGILQIIAGIKFLVGLKAYGG